MQKAYLPGRSLSPSSSKYKSTGYRTYVKKMTMDQCSRAMGPRFIVGQRVRVVDLGKLGHVRTPDYILDRTGVVIQM